MKNSQFYTVSAIAEQACHDIGDFGLHRHTQLLGWALWGARELHFDAGHQVQRTYLELDSFKMCDYPCDYVDMVSMVIQVGDRVMAIGRARDLAMANPTDPDTGELVPNRPANINDSAVTGTSLDIYNGMWYYGFTAAGATLGINPASRTDSSPMPYKGYFNFDDATRKFRFTSEFDTSSRLLLTYVSDGFEASKETLVHPYAADYLKKYIHEQRLTFTPGAGEAAIQRAQKDTEFALRLAKRRRNQVSAQELLSVFFRYYSMTNKITNG